MTLLRSSQPPKSHLLSHGRSSPQHIWGFDVTPQGDRGQNPQEWAIGLIPTLTSHTFGVLVQARSQSTRKRRPPLGIFF